LEPLVLVWRVSIRAEQNTIPLDALYLTALIHNRMPEIVRPEDYARGNDRLPGQFLGEQFKNDSPELIKSA
jgi:hypothetical protein